MTVNYKFRNLDEATEFCKYINLINLVEVTASIGKNQEVDAKSLLGLLSLNLENAITFYMIGSENDINKVIRWFNVHKSDIT